MSEPCWECPCSQQRRHQGLHTQQRSRLHSCHAVSQPQEEISRLPPKPKKATEAESAPTAPNSRSSVRDHLQQCWAPAAPHLLHARQLLQPRDSSAQMTFPSLDKRLLHADTLPTMPDLGLIANGAKSREQLGSRSG